VEEILQFELICIQYHDFLVFGIDMEDRAIDQAVNQ
jgi:hypothetical protein